VVHLSAEMEEKDRSTGWIGTVLQDKWRIDSKIARGGVATVFRGMDREGKTAAIKIMHPQYSRNDDVRRRFLREGYTANKVEHPGVVRVLEDGASSDGTPYIVMELLDNGELLEERRERLGGRLAAGEVVRVCEQVLDVLATAHDKGIVHRDIKPDNIFVLADGTVKVLDFGIAHIKEAALKHEPTATGLLLGTPEFMSPEQAVGVRGQIDAKTDIFSLGATMFTLLSGEAVHVYETLSALLLAVATRQARSLSSAKFKDLPRELVAIVDKALALEKPRRWPSARAMQEALAELRQRLPLAGEAKPSTARMPATELLSVVVADPPKAGRETATATHGRGSESGNAATPPRAPQPPEPKAPVPTPKRDLVTMHVGPRAEPPRLPPPSGRGWPPSAGPGLRPSVKPPVPLPSRPSGRVSAPPPEPKLGSPSVAASPSRAPPPPPSPSSPSVRLTKRAAPIPAETADLAPPSEERTAVHVAVSARTTEFRRSIEDAPTQTALRIDIPSRVPTPSASEDVSSPWTEEFADGDMEGPTVSTGETPTAMPAIRAVITQRASGAVDTFSQRANPDSSTKLRVPASDPSTHDHDASASESEKENDDGHEEGIDEDAATAALMHPVARLPSTSVVPPPTPRTSDRGTRARGELEGRIPSNANTSTPLSHAPQAAHFAPYSPYGPPRPLEPTTVAPLPRVAPPQQVGFEQLTRPAWATHPHPHGHPPQHSPPQSPQPAQTLPPSATTLALIGLAAVVILCLWAAGCLFLRSY
jgi:eukaryotic-like serine/threonine-protein kinase